MFFSEYGFIVVSSIWIDRRSCGFGCDAVRGKAARHNRLLYGSVPANAPTSKRTDQQTRRKVGSRSATADLRGAYFDRVI